MQVVRKNYNEAKGNIITNVNAYNCKVASADEDVIIFEADRINPTGLFFLTFPAESHIFGSKLPHGYVIEIIPEPATVLMFGLGGLAMLRTGRK